MDEIAAALGDGARWRIVELLAERPRSVGELAELTGLRQPQTTKHLQTLEDWDEYSRTRSDAAQLMQRELLTSLRCDSDLWSCNWNVLIRFLSAHANDRSNNIPAALEDNYTIEDFAANERGH